MKTIAKLGLSVVTALSAVLSAHALSITPATLPQWTGNQTSEAEIQTIIAPTIGPATSLYKQNVGGAEEGTLAGSYTTVFDNTATDPSDATITWNGPEKVGPTAWLLVKDGNNEPAWYLFNLTGLGWDGEDTLELTGFWPGKGAISHVSLYGSTNGVPDGGTTLLLLGAALSVLGFAGRKVRKA